MIKLQRQLLYVLRMKWKYGEYVGLSHVAEDDKLLLAPHVSLPMPNDWDHEDKRRLSIEECQTKFADRLSKHWRRRPAIIDSHRYDDDPDYSQLTPHPIRAFAESARVRGCAVIPVLPINASGSLTVAVREVVRRNGCGVVIKLRMADLEGGQLRLGIDTALGAVGIEAENAILCIDLGDVEISEPYEIAQVLAGQIAAIPYIKDWAHAYISAGSFSVQVGKLAFNSTTKIERTDWQLFLALMEGNELPRQFAFSDFGVEDSNFAKAPKEARASAHLRYTDSLQWIVSKGGSIRKLGYKAIQSAANLIKEKYDFRGAAFSFGDGLIQRIMSGTATGNPSIWRAAGVSHHAAVVLLQLRGLFGVPLYEHEGQEDERQQEFFPSEDERR